MFSFFQFLFFIVCAFISWWIYKLVLARLSPIARLPGYELYNPILGNVAPVLKVPCFERWQERQQLFGFIYKFYSIMGHAQVIVTHPDYLKHVLVTNSKNYIRGALIGVEVFRKIVGDHSMVMINGAEHKRHRSIVSPAFRMGNLRKLLPVMQQCSRRLCDYFDRELSSSNTAGNGRPVLKSVNIRRHMSHVTLQVIGMAGFGFDFDCIGKQSRGADSIAALTGNSGALGIMRMLPFSYYYPLPAVRKFWLSLWSVHRLIEDLVRHRLSTYFDSVMGIDTSKNLLDMIIQRSRSENKDMDPLSQDLMHSDKMLSEAELRDEIMTFIMAGHETSSLALTLTIGALGSHEEWQDRCREEIQAVLGSNLDRDITWEDMNKLKVTRAVINESLRLYPPVPALSRRAVVDDEIGSYHIPAGTDVILVPGHMHRLPEIWGPNANEFSPDRFLELDATDPVWGAFMPFGDGHHKCLGFQFALAEITMVLAAVLNKYKIRPVTDWNKVTFQNYVTLQTSEPILVDLEPVEH